MGNQKQRFGRILKAFAASQLLFFMPIIAQDPYVPSGMSQDVSQWTPAPSSCGPDCPCGCQKGGECTCYNGYYNYQDQNYNKTDTSCDEDCLERPTNIDPGLYVYENCCDCGTWLPEDPVLFRPFMADPREICYSAGWRFNDNAMTKNVIDVSFGDTLALYRWCRVGPWGGELQIEIEGALWAVFDPTTESSPLLNADYYGGMPITYAFDNWQFRLRLFHISSHIGDEFLLNHPHFDRRNASAEYVDFFISHDLTEEIRIYAGLGYLVAQDKEFIIKPFYSAIGTELRLLSFGFFDRCDSLYGCPIFAMHFRQNGEFKKHIDATYILGYEFGKTCGLYRKLRFFIEYHDGYSAEGQFVKKPTNYFSVRTSYGF